MKTVTKDTKGPSSKKKKIPKVVKKIWTLEI